MTNDDDHLHKAFETVYLDLCCHGVVPYDERTLWRLWRQFLADMQAGFPSLMEGRHGDQ